MADIRVIQAPSKAAEIKEVLAEVGEMAESLDCVIVLGLFKDSSQLLRTTSISGMEKAFLCQFFSAWMNNWFEFSGRE